MEVRYDLSTSELMLTYLYIPHSLVGQTTSHHCMCALTIGVLVLMYILLISPLEQNSSSWWHFLRVLFDLNVNITVAVIVG